ncbi:MAG: histidinol dehydrogenase [Patescibacteria group bacterium]|nr:histidinol dehydrogenase [Patescibacteria group bacterium]
MYKQQLKNVQKIIKDVRSSGDLAVQRYAKKFDGLNIKDFQVGKEEIKKAYQQTDRKTFAAVKAAGKRIKDFAAKQMAQYKDFGYARNGVTVGQKIVPIKKIGVYVPGGKYPLVSSALMGIIPAKVAGVREIVVCSPKICPAVIAAADWAGANSIFNIGGVQAIAAMAYGTKSIPKVDKIVGPGNIYVTLAKKEIYGQCGIDMLAGPSEVLIIADNTASPKFLKADLLAQLEHDPLAKATLISVDEKILLKTKKEIGKPVKNLKIIGAKSLSQAFNLANNEAPEHLVLAIENPKKYLSKLKNFGSLFLGNYSAVAFGDYCSGTNHILPTNQNAKFASGLSVRDFVKIQTYQQISRVGVKQIAETASQLARAEGLFWHEKSIVIRKK